MKEHEIEKLREKLGDEFEVTEGYNCAVITVKDIWKGVEFAECVDDHLLRGSIEKGKIYKTRTTDLIHCVGIEGKWGGFGKEHFKPSTESAYVEQLKDKAKELYGDIKDGDRFDTSELGYKCTNIVYFMPEKGYKEGFDYLKQVDRLYYSNVLIYKQGKWAKKIEEPIRVNVSSVRYFREPIEYMGEIIPSGTIDCTVHFTIEGSSPKIILRDDFRQLLSKCLEDYLNKS